MTAGVGEPLRDTVSEGSRIATVAAEQGVALRVLGGVAVAMQCPSARAAPLSRDYADVDLATVGSARDSLLGLMTALGYTPDREFNTLHGERRLFFWDPYNERQVDVFVDEAHLCHTIDLRGRLQTVPLTLSLADLLILKLQVVETNEKDFVDVCALLADHDLSADDSGVNSGYIAGLAASDWGLWRTLGMVAERSAEFARGLAGFDHGERVAGRLERLRAELDTVPKSRGWKLRSRVGEKKRWYTLPEEVR
jgi:hypothetical protein